MRVSLVHNRGAGRGVLSRAKLVGALEQAGHTVGDNGEVVLVAGGDGTVTRAASQLVEKRQPLIVLPIGTANNVARSLGYHPTDHPIEYVRDVLDHHEERDFDVGVSRTRFGTRLFYEGAGVGLFTDALDEVLTKADKEPSHAARKLAERLRDYEPVHMELSLDGRDLSGDYVMVDVMNVSHFGPKLHLTPEAHPFDGKFDVALVRAEQRGVLLAYLEALGRGEEAAPPAITVERARKVQLRLHGKKLRLDGHLHPRREVPGDHAIELVVLRGALRVWLPLGTVGENRGPRTEESNGIPNSTRLAPLGRFRDVGTHSPPASW